MADTLTIRIPESLRADLDKISREEGIPVGAVVRRWLTLRIQEWKLERLRARMTAAARKAGYLTEEDILNIPS